MNGTSTAGPGRHCASDPAQSRGRRHVEVPAPQRDAFQRDRDRIVHCTAFRRLVYKTQVFLNHEGDLFRTRLTHSLEVAQLGRSMARTLGLNEDLVEAISLAHDLGHTPFGHAGQDALHECLNEVDLGLGGFEHNLQSLRVVDQLEERYPLFDGLNLSFETREGVLKHCSLANARRLLEHEPGGIAQRFIDRTQPSLEAQLCNLADQMAYNAHDVDDGIRAGILSLDQLDELSWWLELKTRTLNEFPGLSGRRLLFELLRRLLAQQVHDVIETTARSIGEHAPESAEAARRQPELIRMSADVAQQCAELKSFLRIHLYRHRQITETTDLAKQVVRELFTAYCDNPAEIGAGRPTHGSVVRRVADYVAGMTDRFALREHERLTGKRLFD